jgi:hypothetical protein
MKLIKFITLFIIITAAAVVSDCSKESDKQVIPGYLPPGAFRPKGIAREKVFRMDFIDNSTSPATTIGNFCSSGTNINDPTTTDPTNTDSTGRCMAVYGLWLTGTSYTTSYPTEGIALNDSYNPTTSMTLKMIRYPNTPWTVYLYLNGVRYTNRSVSDIELVTCESVDYTTPAYTKPDGEVLASSGVRLKLTFIRFLNDIDLTATVQTSTGPVTTTLTITKTGDLPDPARLPTWIEEIPGTPPTYVQHYNLPTTGDYILAQKFI